jgi:MFS family permease
MLPFAGPLADRYPRRTLAIGSDVVRLALVTAMAALAYAGSPSIPVLYVHAAILPSRGSGSRA